MQAAFPSKISYMSPQDMAPRPPTLQLRTSRCEDHNSQIKRRQIKLDRCVLLWDQTMLQATQNSKIKTQTYDFYPPFCIRTAFFWVITQRVVVISYRRFGTTYRSHLRGLKVGPIVCPETSVINYHYSLRNNPKARSSHLLGGGILGITPLLTLILLTWRKWWAPNNASKQQMGFNSGFKGLIHLVVCLTTGPKPLLKRALRIVPSRASSFKWEYPLLSLRSSSSFLRLLPCLPVTSIHPCIFPSVTRCRRQFRRKMWPIQFAFRLRISCRIFLCSLTLSKLQAYRREFW